MSISHWHVYMVRCADGSLYTDITSDTDEGVRLLNAGEGTLYVRARLPVFLAYSEEYMNEVDARRRADRIRRMSRAQKEALLTQHSYASVADVYQFAGMGA